MGKIQLTHNLYAITLYYFLHSYHNVKVRKFYANYKPWNYEGYL
jgi:hypothetical protein